MPDAFIYDAVRTPRGRGKPDGSLHEVPTVDLAVTTLEALRRRNDLDPVHVEDVVLGCVDPVGEAGGDIARAAVLKAGFGKEVPGVWTCSIFSTQWYFCSATASKPPISPICTKEALSWPSDCMSVCGRMCSSLASSVRPLMSLTGTTEFANRPSSQARAARRCDSTA